MYSIGVGLENFGFIAGKAENSNIALSGHLDMPVRLGKTHHDWAKERWVEPYVTAADILTGGFGGRDIVLNGYIKGSDRYDCDSKRRAMFDHFDNINDLVPLTSKWGTHQVLISGPVEIRYINPNYLVVKIPMREPICDMSGIIPNGTGSEFGIDGIDFKSLGGTMVQFAGDRRNRPGLKSSDISVFGKEGYQVTKTVAPQLTLKLYIKQPNYAAFVSKIKGIEALFAAPGIRSLTVNNDTIRGFFVKDGFKVNMMYSKVDCFLGMLECVLTETDAPGSYGPLTDALGDYITDNSGNIITVRL